MKFIEISDFIDLVEAVLDGEAGKKGFMLSCKDLKSF